MAKPLRTLIVDDEPAAIRRLVRLCETLPAVTVVATADSGDEARKVLDRVAIDLILLDIEMPGMSGLALGEYLVGRAPAPAIVFVTAFERFAIAAFAVDAVGYLLKPVDPALLRATIDRVAQRTTMSIAPAIFWAPYRGSLLRLEDKDIDHISGEGDYARLHCGDKSYLVAERLYAIEKRLGGDRFIRVHRSVLVNRDRVAALALEGGSWAMNLTSGHRVAIGRSYLANLRTRLRITG